MPCRLTGSPRSCSEDLTLPRQAFPLPGTLCASLYCPRSRSDAPAVPFHVPSYRQAGMPAGTSHKAAECPASSCLRVHARSWWPRSAPWAAARHRGFTAGFALSNTILQPKGTISPSARSRPRSPAAASKDSASTYAAAQGRRSRWKLT